MRLLLASRQQPPEKGVRGNHRSPEMFPFYAGRHTIAFVLDRHSA
jgi:hypothetical protein